MGKIVRFDTFTVIKDAAARAEAREKNPVARLDQRAERMAVDFAARQRSERPIARRSRRRTAKSSGGMVWNPSGKTIYKIGMGAFAAFSAVFAYIDTAVWPTPPANSIDTESASFSFCHSGGGSNCVVDGDTIWYQGNNIRIADIDTPETHPSRCANEAELGTAATQQLQSLLNDGAFSIQTTDRDTDVYGRQLRILTRDGDSIGGKLVDNGVARWYKGGRRSWC